jgi:eukaryotic-like serine/threonine-protein kinase
MEPQPPRTLQAGETVGHYRIVQHLASGGMGSVFLAHDQRLDRDVALKVLADGSFADARARRLFRSEALTLSRINHPNVETVFDFDTRDGLDVLVLEHVAGETLADRLRAGPLPETAVADLGAQLVAGLVAIHDAGIVHRDLKPANLRVTPDRRLKILDLGLATLMPAVASTVDTRSGVEQADPSAGTPRYMAPEQVRGEPVDARTDIFATGAVLYEMCAGHPPFRAHGLMALAGEILHDDPPAPRSSNDAISPDLERIVLKALEKDPNRRYQSARELLRDLEGLTRSRPPLIVATSRRAPRLRHIVVGIVLLALGTGGWWTASQWAAPPPRFAAHDWVLVADFDNTTGRAALEQTLREALTLTLQQSRYVNVLPRDRIVAALGRMARPPGAPIDVRTALDLGRRESVAVVLAGEITTDGGNTLVTVKGLAVPGGRTLFVEREAITANRQLQAKVDALATRVRRDLGESGDQIQESRSLAEVTTPSTDALERYSRAASQFAGGNLEEAGLSLRAAIALDPGFAMAHQLLARVYGGLGDSTREREHLERAWMERTRLTDRERLVIEAAHASLTGDYDSGLERLQTLVGLYPDDASARQELGLALSYAGRKAAAVAQLRQSIAIDPYRSRARAALLLILTEVNEPQEALRLYDEAAARGPSTPDLKWGQALALFGADRLGEARAALTSLVAEGVEPYRLYGALSLERLALYTGAFAEARASLRDNISADQQAGRGYAEWLRRYLLGRTALVDGDVREARRQARAILEDPTGGELRLEHLHYAGVLAAMSGDAATADSALARLRTLAGPAAGFARSCERHLAGEIARVRGRLPEAIEAYQASAAAYPNYLAHQGLAMIYDAQQQAAEAIREWEAVVAARGDVLRNGFPVDWVVANLRLARLYTAAGDSARAAAGCAAARTAWAHADDTRVARSLFVQCPPPGGSSPK